VLEEEELTDDLLYDTICRLYEERSAYAEAMAGSSQTNAIETIIGLIEEQAN